jgi:NurA domain
MDGPLIAWPLGWLEPRTRREEAARLFLEALDAGEQLRFPVAGYISRTRSIDVIQMLKFTLCEASEATGRFCPACETAVRGRPDPMAPPCFAAIDGLLDIQLMAELLPAPGARSAVFESNNKVLRQLYGAHRRIGFFFVNAGLELARVEVPEWVWRDPEQLAGVHAAVYRQIRLGMGYPIALSEAHEQAVVRAPERQAFYELLRRTLLRDRLPAESSAKAMRKRGPIA